MFEKRVLNNGLRLVSEKISYVKSVSIGVWIGTGSRNETPVNNGVSHFIEHMLFKGTKSRTAKEIAESIDSLGGQLNAFTGKECTCFYARCLDSHIDTAVEVLADMLFNSNFSEKDIKLEKQVVNEEIGMYEDTPEELVHDILSAITWDNDPLGYPILGTQKTVTELSRERILEYMNENYTADRAVISVAGNFDTENMVNLVEKYFGNWNKGKRERKLANSSFTSNVQVREKEIEQAHICIGLDGLEHDDKNLYTEIAINNVFGGGMSSRLFQKIREKRGFAYSVYSYPTSYIGAGLFSVYAAMNPSNVEEVIKLIMQEIKLLCDKGLSLDEINKSKEQLKGNYILGLESTSGRMNSIGKSELILGKIYTPEEILQRIDNINMDSVNETIERIFKEKKFSFAVVGKSKKDIDYAKLLNS